MTNAERQGKDILAQECKTGRWAVDKTTGEVVDCSGKCKNFCLFYNLGTPCQRKKVKWLNAEYKPKREFSEADKAVLRALPKIEWVVRDRNGTVFGFTHKPIKRACDWDIPSLACRILQLGDFSHAEFLPISWDDKKPTNRKEILGEE